MHQPILVVCLNPTFQETMLLPHLLEGEVNRCQRHFLCASGKGMNAARVLSQAGTPATLLTHLGGVRIQQMLDLMANDSGVQVLWADSKTPMRTCTTLINEANNTTTELVQEPYPVAPGTEQEILRLYGDNLSKFQGVIFTGTRTPGYPTDLYPSMVAQATAMGKTVVLDVKGADLLHSLQYRPTLIKPNLSEFAATFLGNRNLSEQEDHTQLFDEVAKVCSELHEAYGVSVVVSRGVHGLWYDNGQGLQSVPCERVQTVNTIGCGDALTAGITQALVDGATLQQAVASGIHFGAENAKNLMPGSILKDTIQQYS